MYFFVNTRDYTPYFSVCIFVGSVYFHSAARGVRIKQRLASHTVCVCNRQTCDQPSTHLPKNGEILWSHETLRAGMFNFGIKNVPPIGSKFSSKSYQKPRSHYFKTVIWAPKTYRKRHSKLRSKNTIVLFP